MDIPKVKICCISSIEESHIAIKAGASAIGLVSEMPSGPGIISEKLISQIAKTIPPFIDSFLLTSKQDADSIIRQLKKCNTNTVQIVDNLLEGNYLDIKTALPKVKIIQVLHIQNKNSIEEAINISKYVDGILLDSGNKNLVVKKLGGTGRTHDWSISKRIVESVSIPVYLAGGLNPDNISEAVNTVHPYGVDICSGVRTDDKLDLNKLLNLFTNLKSVKME